MYFQNHKNTKMKFAVALCLMCVVAVVYGQAGRTAAGSSGSSDALRALMAQRMLSGRGGGLGRLGSLPTLMMLRGAYLQRDTCITSSRHCLAQSELPKTLHVSYSYTNIRQAADSQKRR